MQCLISHPNVHMSLGDIVETIAFCCQDMFFRLRGIAICTYCSAHWATQWMSAISIIYHKNQTSTQNLLKRETAWAKKGSKNLHLTQRSLMVAGRPTTSRQDTQVISSYLGGLKDLFPSLLCHLRYQRLQGASQVAQTSEWPLGEVGWPAEFVLSPFHAFWID